MTTAVESPPLAAADAPPTMPGGRWFTRSVFGFGAASFLSDIGHETATSALPAFLASFGAPPAVLGIIEGVADGASSLAKLVGGWLADRPGWRRPIAVLGYFATGLSNGAYALCTGWTSVLLVRCAGWTARGIRAPARNALLADSVPPEACGRAFGFQRALDSAGAVLGPLFAVLLVQYLPLRSVLGWSMLPGVLAAAVFAACVGAPAVAGRALRRSFRQSLAALPQSFRGFLGAALLFGTGDFARTLLILRATQLLEPQLGAARATAAAMTLYAVHNLVYAALAYPAGRAADRWNPRRLLVAGYILGAAAAFGAAAVHASLPALVAVFVLGGAALAVVDTLEATVTGLAVPSALRGTAFGALATVNGAGDLLSSSLVGVLWSAYGPAVAFGTAGLACLCGGGVLAAMTRAAGRSASRAG